MFYCSECGRSFKEFRYTCSECGNVLVYDFEEKAWLPRGNGVWRYQSMIPVKKRVSMQEGGTPLVRRRDVEEPVFLKLEGDNPTGSFKDRGTTVVLSNALNRGYRTVAVASTGNMGASVAAYAAYANLKAKVFVPEKTPEEKLLQIRAYGADVVRVNGSFDDCVERMKEESLEKRYYMAMTGLNPYYLEGEKTVGFEILEQLGDVPDAVVVPMGTGGLLSSVFKAFEELKELGVVKKTPRMIGVQARACDPIVKAWKNNSYEVRVPKRAKTIASAINVKIPFNAVTALNAINNSGGEAVSVSDLGIIRAVKELGREGVFAEPSAAVSLAGLKKIDYDEKEKIVLLITGSGLKQPIMV